MRLKLSIALLVILSPVLCMAQALSDRVPSDAVVYFGWRGTSDPGAGYDQSHLKAVLDSSQFAKLLNESLPKFLHKITDGNPEMAQPVNTLLNIGGPLWRHPTAFFLLPIDKANASPLPRAALLCDAGDEAASLSKQIKDLLTSTGAGDDFKVDTLDHLVVLSTFAFKTPTNSLAKNAAFLDAMSKMPKDPVTSLYVDGAASLAMMDQMIEKTAPPDFKTAWPKVRDALGLAGIKKMVWAEGFEGKNWAQQVFIDAPAPRTGLLAMFDSKPISDDALKIIPSTSTMAAAGAFDISALFDVIHDGIRNIDPDTGRDFDQFLSQLNQMAGIDVNKDLLAAFGPEWSAYTDPVTAGNGGMGFVLANRARNAKTLEASLGKVEGAINELIQSNAGGKIFLGFKRTMLNGIEIHYFNSPLVTPAWAIKDGVIYISSYPQMVASAITAPKDGKSILDNPAFLATRQRLGGPAQVSSIEFSDLQKTAPDTYQTLLIISRLYVGIGDIFGLDGPPLLLPSMDKITAELEPAGQITWSNAAGFHARGLAPFPGSQTLSAGGGLQALVMGEMGITLGYTSAFWFMRSEPRAEYGEARTEIPTNSAANLRQIGMGCMLYTNENKGAYPPDLGTVMTNEDLPPASMLNPDLGHKLPDNWATMTKDDQAKWANENSDYVYVGAGLKAGAEPGVVVAHEKIDPNGAGNINILFADGHVDSQPREQAKKTIEASKKLRDNPQ